MLTYNSPKTTQIKWEESVAAGVRILVRHEYTNHETVSGNKWWKLRYNLDEAKNTGASTLLTFGGAHSNMIYATAAAAKLEGMRSIGIIRGEEVKPLNPTLTFATKMGMHLRFVSRERYRQKTETEFIDELKREFGDFYLLPEGGTNELAVKGCREWGEKIIDDSAFDYLCLPVGTGGTIAGVISGIEGRTKVLGFSSLKGGDFLTNEVRNLLNTFHLKDPGRWSIEARFHFGGYGKSSDELARFITEENESNNLPLDFVYTSKMMYGIRQLVREKFFPKGSTVLALHTGGLR